MKKKTGLAFPASEAHGAAVPAVAQFALWQDYQLSEPVTEMVLVKVGDHMLDKYLEGLQAGFVPANEVGKALGYVIDHKVYVSDLPSGGDFNVILVVVYRSIADFGPNKARDEALAKGWGETAREATRVTMTGMNTTREFRGQYLMREVDFQTRG
jgi:hypothetical protein